MSPMSAMKEKDTTPFPDAFELDEFRMSFGDPRPTLHNMLVREFPKAYVSPVKAAAKGKFNIDTIMTYKCDAEYTASTGKDRPTLLPKLAAAKAAFENALTRAKQPLVILPAMAINKLRCAASNNRDRHVGYFIYNRNTQELERIDIKKHSIEGFKLRIMDRNAPALIKTIQPKLKMQRELELPGIIKRRFKTTSAHAYPLFVLLYLKFRGQYPTENRKAIISRVTKADPKEFQAVWQTYAAYSKAAAKSAAACPGTSGLIRNPSNNLCVNPNNKDLTVEVQAKECGQGKMENPVSGRCVLADKVVKVELLQKRLAKVNVRPGEEFEHVDTKWSALYVNVSVTSKYPHAFFVYPHDMAMRTIKKSDYRLQWDAKIDKLIISPSVRKNWHKGMADPTKRFVISLVTLAGTSGFHANSIIYDKQTNELEIFDPMGREISSSYHVAKLYTSANKALKQGKKPMVPKDATLFIPEDYCPPSSVFQSREVDEVSNVGHGGACAIWRLYWIDIRMANPDVDRKALVRVAMKWLRSQESFTATIRAYQKYVLKMVKDEFPKRKVTPKDWEKHRKH